MKITIRPQRVSDAKRFYEILNEPGFKYFGAPPPKSVAAEREYLKKRAEHVRTRHSKSYSILAEGHLVGGCGLKFDQHRSHLVELGYFVEKRHWGQGIATRVVKLLETEIRAKHPEVKRLEIRMDPRNKASTRVAIKNGYRREGLLRGAFQRCGKLVDNLVYAKLL